MANEKSAKKTEQEVKAAEATKPAEVVKPVESVKPAEAETKAAETTKSEPAKFVFSAKAIGEAAAKRRAELEAASLKEATLDIIKQYTASEDATLGGLLNLCSEIKADSELKNSAELIFNGIGLGDLFKRSKAGSASGEGSEGSSAPKPKPSALSEDASKALEAKILASLKNDVGQTINEVNDACGRDHSNATIKVAMDSLIEQKKAVKTGELRGMRYFLAN
jgi:hypothetical protein